MTLKDDFCSGWTNKTVIKKPTKTVHVAYCHSLKRTEVKSTRETRQLRRSPQLPNKHEPDMLFMYTTCRSGKLNAWPDSNMAKHRARQPRNKTRVCDSS